MNRQFDLIVLGSGSAARDGANNARAEYGTNASYADTAGMHHAFPTFAEGIKAAAERAGARG